MARALALAARGLGRTSPNPAVGAVVVRGDRVVGEGWHRAAGTPHAEAIAIQRAGAEARGATLYVTLEPCSHRGRTPPCADAVIASGVARVVAAMRDPNPQVNGRGFRKLRDAGIAVEEGLLADRAARLNEGFISRLRTGRPFVLLKLALTVDGRANAAGRRYLTGPVARKEVHRLRDRNDAVLVGIGTVLADDPQLTVRDVRGRDPLRVVVDTEARTPLSSRVVRVTDPQRTLVLVARDAEPRRVNRLRDKGVLLATLPRDRRGGLDLAAALRWLGDQGVNSVLAEPGPRLASALVRDGLADRMLLYVTPVLAGSGAPAFDGLPGAHALRDPRIRRVGPDVAVEGYLS